MVACCSVSLWNFVFLGALIYLLYRWWLNFKKNQVAKKLAKWNAKSYEKLIVHGITRARVVPNFSPFILKLETYLKAAKIEYEFDSSNAFGPKHKTPWISYKGVHMGDSQLIIEYLNKELGTGFSNRSKYSPAQLAAARAIRIMTEEHFFWGMASWIWIYGKKNLPAVAGFTPMQAKVYSFFVERGLKRTIWANGLGRHTYEEFISFMEADLRTISQFIGKNKYLLGDEICDDDFAVFGMLGECLWALVDSPYQKLMMGELSNLKDYCERMKQQFWPDWNDHLQKKAAKSAGIVEFAIQVLSSS